MKAKKINIIILLLILIAAMLFTACSKPQQEAPDSSAEESSGTETAAPEVLPAQKEEKKVETPEPVTPTPEPAASTTESATNTPEAAPQPETKSQVTETPEAKPVEPPADAKEPAAENANAFKGALGKPIADQPVLLTSAGQSADVQMVKVLLDRAKVKYIISTVVKADEVKDVKTLILAVGGSSKGLGAAGIDAKEELNRINDVISKAQELKLKIITMHIGGEARRGELSDKFINACVPVADYVIVVEEGNKDSLFTKLTNAGSIPMDTITKITEAVDPLKSAFK